VAGIRRPLALLLCFGLCGALFGIAVSHIPSPEDPALFWVGNFSAPWAVVLAVATGLAYGALGFWWRKSRSLVAGIAVVVPFIAEPLLWRLYRGFLPGPTYLWLVELALGAAALVWVRRRLNLGARQSL